MKLLIWFFAWLVLFTWTFAACQISYGQMYPLPDGNGALLGPIERDTYGPQIGTDRTGRAFSWQADGGMKRDATIEPRLGTYGLGTAADQYGRPLTPEFQPDLAQDQRLGRSTGKSLGFQWERR